MFGVKSGYSYGSALLLLSSIILLRRRSYFQLSHEDKALVFILFGVFLISTLTILLHKNNIKNVDQSCRYLLAMPIFLVLLKAPPRLTYLWAGVIVGIILSTVIATWQLMHGYDRVEGYLNIIHFGNIALIYGVFCVAGIFWAYTYSLQKKRWYILFSLGILSSIYSIIASGSRGTWTAVPAILILIFITFVNKKNFKIMLMAGISAIFVIGLLFSIPSTKMQERANDVVSDITNYVYNHDPRSSVGARLEMWHGAMLSIPKKPITGWNEKDYAQELETLVSENKLNPIVLEFSNNLHNNFIQTLVFQGIIGLIALLSVYIYTFYFFCKRLQSPNQAIKILSFCGATLVISYFLFSMTQVILGRNNGIMFFLMALITLWACVRAEENHIA